MENFNKKIDKIRKIIRDNKSMFMYMPIPILGMLFFVINEISGMVSDQNSDTSKDNNKGFNTELPFEKSALENKNKHEVFSDWQKDSMKNSNASNYNIPNIGKDKEVEKDSFDIALEQMEKFKFDEKPVKKKSNPKRTGSVPKKTENIVQPQVKKLTEQEKILKEIERREKLRQKMNYDEKKEVVENVSIKAYVYRTHNILPNSNVDLTLVTPFVYKGIQFNSGHSLQGTVKRVSSDNKLYLVVESIAISDTESVKINLKAYDSRRRHEGLYFEQAGILAAELNREVQEEGLDELANQTQSGWTRVVTNVIKSNKRKRLTKITMDNDYEMILKNF